MVEYSTTTTIPVGVATARRFFAVVAATDTVPAAALIASIVEVGSNAAVIVPVASGAAVADAASSADSIVATVGISVAATLAVVA